MLQTYALLTLAHGTHSLSFYNYTPTSDLHTLSLHDALPILFGLSNLEYKLDTPIIAINTDHGAIGLVVDEADDVTQVNRSEEHTSELQSHSDLVCRLLLEKKKNKTATKPEDQTQ